MVRKLCKQCGLDSKGSKMDLILRLRNEMRNRSSYDRSSRRSGELQVRCIFHYAVRSRVCNGMHIMYRTVYGQVPNGSDLLTDNMLRCHRNIPDRCSCDNEEIRSLPLPSAFQTTK